MYEQSPVVEMPSGDNSAGKTYLGFGGDWAAGDHCRAVYAEDGAEYEAIVLSVQNEGGYCYATLRSVNFQDSVGCK